MRFIIAAMFAVLLLTAHAPGAEAGQWELGVRYAVFMPTARFDSRLGDNSRFDDDYKPEIVICLHPARPLSIEYGLMVTEHGFSTGTPSEIFGATWLLTQTITAKLHPFANEVLEPYVGGGVNFVTPFNTSSSDSTFSIAGHTGMALQAGFDLKVSDSSWLNLDYRYLDMNTTARLNGTDHRFDISPHVVAFGYKRRF